MVIIETPEELRLESLEEGGIFDSDELIVERWRNWMTTLRRDYVGGDCIRVYHYDLHGTERTSVNNNGYAEVYPDGSDFDEYDLMLRRVGL